LRGSGGPAYNRGHIVEEKRENVVGKGGGMDGWGGMKFPLGKKKIKSMWVFFLTKNDSPDYTQLSVCCFLVGTKQKTTPTEISFQDGKTKRGSIGSAFC
jgi:hypothetical protein